MKIEAKKIQLNSVASAREMIIWGLILVVVLGLGAKQFFAPLSKKVETAQSQLLAKQMELEAYKKFLKGGNAANKKSLEGMDLNRQNMAQKVKDAFGRVNMSPDVVVSELLSALTNPAYAKAALLEKFNFSGEKKQSGYSEMNLDLKLAGTYNGTAQYLSFIRQLPYLIRIDSITIKNKEGENSQGKVEVTAKAVLYVGEQKALENVAVNSSRSDMATDLLVEIMGGKTANTPFSAQPREMSNWSLHELKLTSTMAGGARPTALINGKVFTLGDEIADFRIVEVRPREVVLERGDVRHILKIDENENYGADSAPFITHSAESVPNPNAALSQNPSATPPATEEAQTPPNPENPANSGDADPNAEKKTENSALAGGGSGSSSGGTGGEGASGGSNAAEMSQEQRDRMKAIDAERGVLTGNRDAQGEQVAGDGQEGGQDAGDNPSRRTRLDPNSVEDVEGVPFDELEEVLEYPLGDLNT